MTKHNDTESGADADEWSDWLMNRRFGNDAAHRLAVEQRVLEYADLVLLHAQPRAQETVLDVGAGAGLVAFRALERWPDLDVTLTDISSPLLQVAAAAARSKGVLSQCRFVEASADDLSGIADSSIDLVVARACVAYVSDKTAAFREMYRVLKPGGRISLAEPINQEHALSVRVMRERLQSSREDVPDALLTLLHRWKSAQYPDTEEGYADTPLVNFSEQDLLTLAARAGFRPLHLRLHVDIAPALARTWDAFLSIAPHPLAPTLAEILAERFSEQERQLLERHLRPIIESGTNHDLDRVAYLFGTKRAG